MNEREYALMRQMEDSHWWYATLHESVAGDAKALLAGGTDGRILDAGCGTGGMMEALRRGIPACQVSGLDCSAQAVGHTRRRGFADVTQGSVDGLILGATNRIERVKVSHEARAFGHSGYTLRKLVREVLAHEPVHPIIAEGMRHS